MKPIDGDKLTEWLADNWNIELERLVREMETGRFDLPESNGAELERLRGALEAIAPFVLTEEEVLNRASLNEGRTDGFGVASMRVRKALAPAPEPEKCPECRGTGKQDKHFDGNYQDPQVTCWACKGSGMANPKPVDKCRECEGQGEFIYGQARFVCSKCNGTGYAQADAEGRGK